MQRRLTITAFLILSFQATLFLCVAEAKNQQCRLQARHNQQVITKPPTESGKSTIVSGSPSSRTTSPTPSSSSTSTAIPTLAPFDYTNNKIRGVNL